MNVLSTSARALAGALSLATVASAQLTWNQLSPAVSPAPRYGHAIYLAIPSYRAVLFGGFDGTQAFGDTWGWTGTNWQLRASTGPSPRYGHAMAMLHFSNNSLLMFGGKDAQGTLNGETWVWNGNAWNQLATPVAPSARAGHGLAVDEMLERTLYLFGGRTANGLSSETWMFDVDHWRIVPTATQPPAREGHALAWRANGGGILLTGGRDEQGVLADEWVFDGVDWHPLSTRAAVARADHAFALEYSFRHRYVSFGGRDGAASSDTSELTLQDRWLHHDTLSEPSARTHSAVVVETSMPEESHYILFGGRSASGAALGDTWRLKPTTIASVESFGSSCGPGPWGPSGPVMMVSQPLLGSPVEVRVMALPPQKRALLLIGHELAPVGTCGLLVQPTRTVAVPLNDLGGSLAYGEYLLEIPFDPALNGTQMALQIVLRAPAGQPTPAFSQGVRLTLAE